MTNGDIGPEGSYFEAREREKTLDNERKWDGVYPIIITLAYLVLGFSFHLWHPGWLLFLTIPVYYMKPKNSIERWLNPVSITIIFLVLGIFFGMWHPAWMLFLLIPVVEVLKKKSGEPAKDTETPNQ